MIILVALIVAAAIGVGAAITVLATARIEAAYPAAGRFVEVAGGRLHVLELGPAGAREQPPPVPGPGASGKPSGPRRSPWASPSPEPPVFLHWSPRPRRG